MTMIFNPETDLKLERILDVPPELVWKAWTTPEHLQQWFVPKPWTITHCEIDLRVGGVFATTMRSPEGQEFPNPGGCYLEIIENRKLVFTDALQPGFRPAATPFFTAILELEPHGTGTKYTAYALHRDTEGREKHEQMGFHEGWGMVAGQMVEEIKKHWVK
jgi:uncharacterized protein YndB with AHSA1/START domain